MPDQLVLLGGRHDRELVQVEADGDGRRGRAARPGSGARAAGPRARPAGTTATRRPSAGASAASSRGRARGPGSGGAAGACRSSRTAATSQPARSTVASLGTRKSLRVRTWPSIASASTRAVFQTVSPSGTTSSCPAMGSPTRRRPAQPLRQKRASSLKRARFVKAAALLQRAPPSGQQRCHLRGDEVQVVQVPTSRICRNALEAPAFTKRPAARPPAPACRTAARRRRRPVRVQPDRLRPAPDLVLGRAAHDRLREREHDRRPPVAALGLDRVDHPVV